MKKRGRAKANAGLAFTDRLLEYRKYLEESERHLRALGLESELADVREAASREEFRVSVLGRFKTGKSSCINALAGAAVSPMDVLPCTTSIIELRGGDELTFREQRDGKLRDRTRADFQRAVTVAGKGAHGGTLGTWHITVPAPWFAPGMILVDTPGTDEDPSRLEMALAELGRTDAALVVMRADQLGSLSELDQVGELAERVGLVMVVINRADEVPVSDHPRLLSHARRLVAAHGVPPERVVLMSAAGALAGDSAALEQLSDVQDALSDVLLRNVAGARLASFCRRTESLLERLEPKIAAAVESAEKRSTKDAADADAARSALEHSKEVFETVRQSFSEASSRSARRAGRAMRSEWPTVLEQLMQRKSGWKSRHSPLTSPKRFTADIGECAKRDLDRLIERGIADAVQPVIEEENQSVMGEVHRYAAPLLAAVSATSGSTSEGLERQIVSGALEDAFGRSLVDAGGAAVGGAALAAVVSSLVGYIVADVVLFYVLSLVTGLLNPVILAGAALVGITLFLTKGREWLASWARDKIAEKLGEELAKAEVERQVVEAAESGASEVMGKLSNAYLRHLERVVADAKRAHQSKGDTAEKSRRETAKVGSDAQHAREALRAMRASLGKEASELEGMVA